MNTFCEDLYLFMIISRSVFLRTRNISDESCRGSQNTQCMLNTYYFSDSSYVYGGTRWYNWLRHCAISRKIAGSIPDYVIGIFHWRNPSGRIIALGLTQLLTEKITRNISLLCRLSWNLGASISCKPQGLSRPVMGLLYFYFSWRLWDNVEKYGTGSQATHDDVMLGRKFANFMPSN